MTDVRSGRRAALRTVIDHARRTSDHVAPWRGAPDVEAQFDGEADLLVELHHEWVRLLVAALHRGEIDAAPTPAAVREIYDEIAQGQPTLRAILDTHRAHPALWDPTAREHAMIARLAAVAPEDASDEAAAAIGRVLATQRIPVQRHLGGRHAARESA